LSVDHCFQSLAEGGSTSIVNNALDGGCPLLKLRNPVGGSGGVGYNEEGTIVFLEFNQVSDEGDDLDGLAKTQLICQDAVEVVGVKGYQPL
jgi:hypothetical protein